MIKRNLWLKKLRLAWQKRSVVWLSGVRRVGKTTLTRMLPDATYMNCDLPSVTRSLEDPELFLHEHSGKPVLVFDEVHRLPDPSLLLKIAADEFPQLKVLATGSSTLAATGKFRDSLAGRKQTLFLCPVLWEECAKTFGKPDLDHRLLHGGLPESLLAGQKNAGFFNDWIDSFYARDIQELFGFRNRQGFLALFRLLLRQSGGLLDYTQMTNSIESISRPTVISHVAAMQIAHAVHLLPPFHGGGRQEIVSRPKCYAFDTGFVTFEKGWDSIRDDDREILWEHLALDSLRFRYADDDIFYWRDKSRREIDFVVRKGNGRVDIFECKINPDKLNPASIQEFRKWYPHGENFIISPFVKQSYKIRRGGVVLTVRAVL